MRPEINKYTGKEGPQTTAKGPEISIDVENIIR
jgi:hypothetical protein